MVIFELTVTPIPLRALPDLVVIRITPFAALAPYNAAAVFPFNTDIFSISSGLMMERPSPASFPPHKPALPRLLLSIGIPLITYSGWSLPPKEEPPRINTLDEAPAPVAGTETLTPATLP